MPRFYCGPLTDLTVIAQVLWIVVSLVTIRFHVRPLRSDRQTETGTLECPGNFVDDTP
jgi:K+ transporter